MAREHNIDTVARQHEAGDAFDVIDADGDGLHPVPEHGGERGPLARAGDLGSKHRLVRLDGREHDVTGGGEVRDLAEGAGRERLGRHGKSRSDMAPSSLPKRSGFAATTIALVASGFFCASRLRARISA